MAVSVGGSVTGQGGSKLILDDPHSADEAHSRQMLSIAGTWFREVWFNRMNNPLRDKMVVIGQRVHVDDIPGIILAEYGAEWVHLNLPEEFDPRRRCQTVIWADPRTREGELLWPERFDMRTVERYKAVLGPIAYAAQYLQEPMPIGGAVFKKEWLRYYQDLPDVYVLAGSRGSRVVAKSSCWRFATMDLAISARETADYTVIQVWDVTPQNDLLLVDQLRARLDSPEQQKMVRIIHMRYGPEFWVIESVGYQLALIQQLRNAPVNNTDFLVTEIGNPDTFERQILWKLPNIDAYLLREELDYREPLMIGENYVVRVLGDTHFFEYAMEHQGYAKVMGRRGVDQHAISIPIREFRPTRDKVSRASTPAILMANEQVYLQAEAAYLSDLETELLLFPNSSHDDQVDCLSMSAEVIAVPRVPLSDEEWAEMPIAQMQEKLVEMQETLVPQLKAGPAPVDPFKYADDHNLWND
jgi:phage terminase large subunit-like protein